MQLAKATAIYAAPIPLRLILALTFIWAGLGKIVHEVPVQGEQAALLANMGYRFSNTGPNTLPSAAPDTTPTGQPDQDPPTQPTPDPTPEPEPDPAPPPLNEPAPDLPPLLTLAQSDAAQPAARHAPPLYTAADFTEPQQVRSLHTIAILTYTAAHPPLAEDGSAPNPIWPEWAARDHWPITIAWIAAITELTAGILVGIGLLTRLAAVSLVGTMLTAAWLTELGPAIQSGNALFGFIPDYDIWDIYAWRPLLWQLALAADALALCFAGPGALAIDSVAGDDAADDELDED